MKKIDFNREFTNLLCEHIRSLSLSSNSLLSLLEMILETYRFDIRFLFRLHKFAETLKVIDYKFTPSLSGDEEKGEECL